MGDIDEGSCGGSDDDSVETSGGGNDDGSDEGGVRGESGADIDKEADGPSGTVVTDGIHTHSSGLRRVGFSVGKCLAEGLVVQMQADASSAGLRPLR